MNIWVTGVEHGKSVYCIQLRLDTIKQTRYFRAVKLLYIYSTNVHSAILACYNNIWI